MLGRKLLTRKYNLYLKVFQNCVIRWQVAREPNIEVRAAFYGIKTIANIDRRTLYSQHELEYRLITIALAVRAVTQISIKDMLDMFPITKDFSKYVGWNRTYKSSVITTKLIAGRTNNGQIGDYMYNCLLNYANEDIEKFIEETICTIRALDKHQDKFTNKVTVTDISNALTEVIKNMDIIFEKPVAEIKPVRYDKALLSVWRNDGKSIVWIGAEIGRVLYERLNNCTRTR